MQISALGRAQAGHESNAMIVDLWVAFVFVCSFAIEYDRSTSESKTLLVTLLKDKVAIRSAPHTSCEVHAFLGDA